jgi:uncharacterized protein YkwD
MALLAAVFSLLLGSLCSAVPLPDSSSDDSFRHETLAAHNAYRARHGSGPLYLNNTMTSQAQAIASALATGDYAAAYGLMDGSNMFWSGTSDPINGEIPVDKW